MSVLTRLTDDSHPDKVHQQYGFIITNSLFILISIVLLTLLVLRSEAPRIWPGWFVLRIPAEQAAEDVYARLDEAGVSGYLSADTVEIPFMAIPGLEMRSPGDVDSLLLPGDPRRDPFIANVEGLFRSGPDALVYLPADRGAAAYRRLIGASLRNGGVDLIDGRRAGAVRSVLIVLFVGIVLTIVHRRDRAFAALTALPTAAFAILTGPAGILPALLFYGASVGMRDRPDRRHRLVFLVAVLLLLILFGRSRPTAVPALILAGSAALLPRHRSKTGASAFRPPRRVVRRRTEHHLFEPVSLTGRGSPSPSLPSGTERLRGLALLGLVLAAGILGSRPPRIDGAALPAPGTPTGSWLDRSAFQSALEQSGASVLPGAAQMLASRVYQEAFLYGGERFRIPGEDEVLDVSTYGEGGDRIVAGRRIVRQYDAAWFAELVASVRTEGVGPLFAGLDGPAEVIRTEAPTAAEAATPVPSTPSSLVAILIAAFILAYPPRRAPGSRGVTVSLSNSRRRPQAA